MSKLVRLSLKNIDTKQPKKTADSLIIQEVAICDAYALFYVTRKFLYVMENGNFTRFNKATLTSSEMGHTFFDTGEIYQIVGTDRYVYAAIRESMTLLNIDDLKLKLVDEVKSNKKYWYIRSLIPGISQTGISFAICVKENPCSLVIYSALHSRLFVICETEVTGSNYDTILGAVYDEDYNRLILCMEEYSS